MTAKIIPFDIPDYSGPCDKLNRRIIHFPKSTVSVMKVADYLIELFCESKTSQAWSSIETMTKELNLSKTSVIRATKFLEANGFFVIKRADRPHRGTANEYIPQFEIDKKIPKTCPTCERRKDWPVPKGTPEGYHSWSKGSTPVYPSEYPEECHLRSEGYRPWHPKEEAEEGRAKALPSSAKKAAKQARARAREGLTQSLFPEIPDDLQKALSERRQNIRDWESFYQEITSDVLDRKDSILLMFFPDGMSVSAFERSLGKFKEIVIDRNRVPWRDSIEASQRLINWLKKEKWRGNDWGKNLDDD